MPAHEPIRILLVDDQPLFRGAIASLIDGRDDMTVVGRPRTVWTPWRRPACWFRTLS